MKTDQLVHVVAFSDPDEAMANLDEAATVFLNLLDYVAATFPDKLAPGFIYGIEDDMRMTYLKHNVGGVNY